jgi:hypothetical protein
MSNLINFRLFSGITSELNERFGRGLLLECLLIISLLISTNGDRVRNDSNWDVRSAWINKWYSQRSWFIGDNILESLNSDVQSTHAAIDTFNSINWLASSISDSGV